MEFDIETLAPFFLLAVGFLIIYFFIKSIGEANASKSWPNTKGIITRSIVQTAQITFGDENESRSNDAPTIDIEYEYTIEGVMFRSTRIKIGGKTTTTQSVNSGIANISITETDGFDQNFQRGAEVVVYYNPSNPKRSVLETGGSQWVTGLAGIGTIGIAILLYFI